MENTENKKRAEIFFQLKSLMDDMVSIRDDALAMVTRDEAREYVKMLNQVAAQAGRNGIKIADQMITTLSRSKLPSFDEIMTISLKCSYLREWFRYIAGYFDGVTGVKLQRIQKYKDGPGAASAQAGQWTLDAAEKVLSQHGGIGGYYKLPHGQKGPVREKIAKAIKDKDGRNVYNVLKKLLKS